MDKVDIFIKYSQTCLSDPLYITTSFVSRPYLFLPSVFLCIGFTPFFVNYKKGCTQLAAAIDKVYQLLAHGRWFSLGTPASSTTKTGRHDIAEKLLKVDFYYYMLISI
jgi:hypothetical protein